MGSIPPPPRDQLALALAIVKSKPANLDVKEYILQVRQFIKTSREAEVFHSPELFFDSVAFWKQAHDKSEAEQSKLRDRVYELEQCNEMLLARVRAQDSGLGETRVPEASRTRDAGEPPLRARTQLYPALGLPDAGSQAIVAAEDSTAPFMRQLYILQKTLQRWSNNASLLHSAVDLCKRCADEIEGAVSLESIPNGARSKDAVLFRAGLSRLKAILHVVESAVDLIFQAFKRISASEPAGREANILTYHIVCLYETIMNTLARYCEIWASTKASSHTPKFSTQGPKTRSKTSVGRGAQLEHETDGAILLTSLLSGMATPLNPAQPEQQNLIEGFFFILLSRVGKLLCIFNFRDLRLRPELQADPNILPLPAGLVDADLDDQSLDAMCTEAKHLVWLLKQALAIFNIWFALSDPETEGHSSHTRFISSIKARLESTLIQAVFGTEPGPGTHLERPTLPENQNIDEFLKSHRVSQLSVPDWYISEVWSLIGWKLLTRSNTCDVKFS
ncbi:hypothetical protein BJX63DRAFT_427556 [Aspergillus granulosus]|uniref:Uncharacterized protein n=1 Tax=Aspergillus granulosus TaxID=176169 RepID=A0ABR4I1D4_9EURO